MKSGPLELEKKNRAKTIIEDFYDCGKRRYRRLLSSKSFSSLRRVVRNPNRWDRIVEIAEEQGFKLPVNRIPKYWRSF